MANDITFLLSLLFPQKEQSQGARSAVAGDDASGPRFSHFAEAGVLFAASETVRTVASETATEARIARPVTRSVRPFSRSSVYAAAHRSKVPRYFFAT